MVFDLQQLDSEYVLLTGDKERSNVGEAVAREPFSNSPTSSMGTTLHIDAGWLVTLLSIYSCATLFFLVL